MTRACRRPEVDGYQALLPRGVEAGAAFAKGAVVGAVAAKVFPDEAALFAGRVVVIDAVQVV